MLVFGEDIIRWVRPDLMPALEAFQFLVLTSLCKTVGTVVGSIYLALGFPLYPLQSGRPAPRSLLGNGLRPCGYRRLLGLSMLFLIVSQYLVNRLIGLGFAEYLRALARPLAVALWVLTVLAFYRTYIPPQGLGTLIAATRSRQGLSACVC